MIYSPLVRIPDVIKNLREAQYEFFFCGSRELALRFPGEFSVNPDADWDFATPDIPGITKFLDNLGFIYLSKHNVYASDEVWHKEGVDVLIKSPEDFEYFKILWANISVDMYYNIIDNPQRFKLVFELAKKILEKK